ncbi:MAG TPA: ABC transporter ATP-binding protein [Planctomycetota bacterium]|nr:ABC transporter ATP-binding protein [Planctomycetota bacterium]
MQAYHQEDDIVDKQYDLSLAKRLLVFAKPYKGLAIFITILTLVLTVLSVAVGPRLQGLALNYIQPGKIDKRMFIMLALASLANITICLLLSIWQSYSLAKLGQRIIFDIRMKTFGHLQSMSLGFYDKQPVGRLITRVTNDVNAIGDFLSTAMITVVNDIFMIGVLVVAMFWLDYKLASIVLSAIIPLLVITMTFKTKLRVTYRAMRKKLAQLNAYLAESLSGVKVIQSFNQEPKTFNKFSGINYEHFDLTRRAVKYQSVFIPSVAILRGTVIALLLYFGGGLVLKDAITYGIVYTFMEYSVNFFGPIQDLADKYLMFQGAMASAERIFQILDTPIDVRNPALPRELKEDPQGHEIEFDNVTFSYEPGKPVLKNISFKIRKNASIAFVGVTGSGKSTIINLLCRFYDVDSGRILIDGINIKDMSQQDLRRRLGIVLQDVFLFAGTVNDNISLWDSAVTPAKVKDVCEDIFASTFIEKMPNKYDSRVGERGMTLSGGQRQLLAFARTMAFEPSILILDEATSSVDVETEYYIQEAIKKMVKKMTSIIIAHRLSTIQNVDRIYVIHKGEIKETGNHQELMEKKGVYHNLCKIQTDGYLA